VASVLDGGSIEPGRLSVEITESVLVLDNARARVVLEQLKSLGVHIALDDFGTGYSSLSYLHDLPIDTIKIDQSFVAGLAGESETRYIVTAVIQLAHSLGLTVIAEGVETVEQRDELVTLGADLCQGFYFARPMAAARLTEALERGPTDDAGRPVSTWPEAGA
jgi:EAL domain-containing protein (putative c-di-GMP-specific phosphodiesterase class I)